MRKHEISRQDNIVVSREQQRIWERLLAVGTELARCQAAGELPAEHADLMAEVTQLLQHLDPVLVQRLARQAGVQGDCK